MNTTDPEMNAGAPLPVSAAVVSDAINGGRYERYNHHDGLDAPQ